MEKKRKLPARAAARAGQAAKRRNTTPPQRSATPASAPEPEPAPAEDAPPPLPRSVAAGKPLPTVNSPQPDDLSDSEYQSVTESGVLAESLARSRQKWTTEGIFEKYWSKPTKRKGVVIEEPNNPPKDSMTKLGQVTITVEPHVFEATMYGVRDPKPPPPPPPSSERPIIQYGPPNGVMPPPPTPGSATGSATRAPTPTGAPTPAPPTPSQPQTQPPPPEQTKPPVTAQAQTPTQTPTLPAAQASNAGRAVPDTSRPTPTAPPPAPRVPVASPRGMESVLSPMPATPSIPPQASPAAQPQPLRPTPPLASGPTGPPTTSAPAPPRPTGAHPTTQSNPTANGAPATPSTPAPGKPAPGTDPIILTLAEKAGADPHLRDLMKRVAQGEASKHELEQFQAIIDSITAENKRKGSTAGPSADRLLVDGRTVRYFADEVRAILDIVLSSNPRQTSADLRPPAGSDPLVVMLVKTALDDARTREMVRRIAENKPQFSDATDLKAILDRLRSKLAKDKEPQQQQTQAPTSAVPAPPKSNSAPNGQAASTSAAPPQPAPQQALRSKGPPPPPKPDISAVVFEFAGGTGDRYLFPKFSLLEYVPMPAGQGQQVIASFLLVRKGSQAEYPVADPELDYYQPLTIRLYAHTGRHLEHLARVVAPADEVRRYMDDVMRRMTRAEYVLLAMRLPRGDPPADAGAASTGGGEEKEREKERGGGREKDRDRDKEKQVNGAMTTPLLKDSKQSGGADGGAQKSRQMGGVLWTTKPAKAEVRDLPPRNKMHGRAADADEQYQSFIASVSRKDGA